MKYQEIFRAKTSYLQFFTSENNMLSSHVKKITVVLVTQFLPFAVAPLSKYTRFQNGIYIINRTLHGRLEIQNFSSRVENIFRTKIQTALNGIVEIKILFFKPFSSSWSTAFGKRDVCLE